MPPPAIARALEVTPLAGESPMAAVKRFLGPKRGILVLDNFEHLLDAAPLVSDLLVACPGLRVLANGREALQLQAEHRYAVTPGRSRMTVGLKRSRAPPLAPCSWSVLKAGTAPLNSPPRTPARSRVCAAGSTGYR